jgi:hypothetical protein
MFARINCLLIYLAELFVGHATAEIYNSEFTHRIPLTLLAKLESEGICESALWDYNAHRIDCKYMAKVELVGRRAMYTKLIYDLLSV